MTAFSHTLRAWRQTEVLLPAVLLSRCLFFLSQRPVSSSNTHYLRRRIAGLQSLGQLLPADEDQLLSESVRLLQTLDPGNLHEVSERLQQVIFPFTRAEVPARYISANAPPPTEFLGSCERVLLVLGPAIGIGDEIVTFPLPQWIKRATPDVRVTALTSYEGLWAGVPSVDHVAAYHDHDALVRAVRGEHEAGEADLVLLVDFENPDLYRAVAAESAIPRYAELSLGGRVLSVVDNRNGWTYHRTLPHAYFRNLYDGFGELARSLTLSPDEADFIAGTPTEPANGRDSLRVFVSPFSSKYEPSPRYWSALVAGLVPDESPRPVGFVLDPGPNAATRRFARELARAASARADPRAVTIAVATANGPLSLSGALAELARADVVVCADSFAAHAAPRAGCTTLVLASPGLENWRVPSARSYYFDAEATLEVVVAGMRQVLDLHGVRAAGATRPPVGDAERCLASANADLERAVACDASFAELCDAYERFRVARDQMMGRIADWPGSAAALIGDHPYDVPLRDLNGDGVGGSGFERDARSFVRNQWLTWRNTNLRKYLDLRLDEVAA